MKIYTGKGDTGLTSSLQGERVSKDDIRIEVIGEFDELNSSVGLLVSIIDNSRDCDFLIQIQNMLFFLSTHLFDSDQQFNSQCQAIEKEIDLIQDILPEIHSFILPGGCLAAANAHVCRSICRRVERHVVCLEKQYQIQPQTIQILNRLSDYFYILARKLNFEQGIHEKIWQNTCK